MVRGQAGGRQTGGGGGIVSSSSSSSDLGLIHEGDRKALPAHPCHCTPATCLPGDDDDIYSLHAHACRRRGRGKISPPPAFLFVRGGRRGEEEGGCRVYS